MANLISGVILGQTCVDGRPSNQCNDDNAACSSVTNEFRCQCKTGFYKYSANICTTSKCNTFSISLSFL